MESTHSFDRAGNMDLLEPSKVEVFYRASSEVDWTELRQANIRTRVRFSKKSGTISIFQTIPGSTSGLQSLEAAAEIRGLDYTTSKMTLDKRMLVIEVELKEGAATRIMNAGSGPHSLQGYTIYDFQLAKTSPEQMRQICIVVSNLNLDDEWKNKTRPALIALLTATSYARASEDPTGTRPWTDFSTMTTGPIRASATDRVSDAVGKEGEDKKRVRFLDSAGGNVGLQENIKNALAGLEPSSNPTVAEKMPNPDLETYRNPAIIRAETKLSWLDERLAAVRKARGAIPESNAELQNLSTMARMRLIDAADYVAAAQAQIAASKTYHDVQRMDESEAAYMGMRFQCMDELRKLWEEEDVDILFGAEEVTDARGSNSLGEDEDLIEL